MKIEIACDFCKNHVSREDALIVTVAHETQNACSEDCEAQLEADMNCEAWESFGLSETIEMIADEFTRSILSDEAETESTAALVAEFAKELAPALQEAFDAGGGRVPGSLAQATSILGYDPLAHEHMPKKCPCCRSLMIRLADMAGSCDRRAFVPTADDASSWAELRGDHAVDCQWWITRAYRHLPDESVIR